ncbi:uncharacterized protein F4807DRAFT_375571 [Annulohypoxylon truncatum]|uniref:uncharacterized protein n=1 Tax=Annulohypoxylon truncatum TaxID=327061 RepID=UPI0020076597|nr:uncharacterized protein F4807DRAFT_375571 [Annulohypoxylon truncatum]KAI1204093.1 hypothetical protein F4807DRAFT_375571 [Annulohypoxylon truncatum]
MNPFTRFEWGPKGINPDQQEVDELIENPNHDFRQAFHRPYRWNTNNINEPRTLIKDNAYGIDEQDFLEDVQDPQKYYETLLSFTPIRPWFDAEKVVSILSRVAINQKTSNSYIHRLITKELTDVMEFGQRYEWNADNVPEDKRPRLPDVNGLEALRILGDAKLGFGTMTRKVEKQLLACGLVWLLQPPQERRKPTFWQKIFDSTTAQPGQLLYDEELEWRLFGVEQDVGALVEAVERTNKNLEDVSKKMDQLLSPKHEQTTPKRRQFRPE